MDWSKLPFQIMNFAVMLFILYRLFVKSVLRALDERAKRVTRDLDNAEQREHEAEVKSGKYRTQIAEFETQIETLTRAARQDMERIQKETLVRTQSEIQTMYNRVEREIEIAQKQSLDHHRNELGWLVIDGCKKMIREMGGDLFQRAIAQEFVSRLTDMPATSYHRTLDAAEAEVVRVDLVSASKVEEDILQSIEAWIAAWAERPIYLVQAVDPLLVAGVTLRFGDVMVDGSLKGNLDSLYADYVAEQEPALGDDGRVPHLGQLLPDTI